MPNYNESINDFTSAFYNKAGAIQKLPDTYLANPSDGQWLGDQKKSVIQSDPLPGDYWQKFYKDTAPDNSQLAPPSSPAAVAPVPRSRPAWLRAIIGEPKMDPVPWSGNDRGWSQFEDWRDDPANGSFGGVPVTINGGNVEAPTPRNRPFSFFRRDVKPRSKVDATPSAPSSFKGTSTKSNYVAGQTYRTKDGRTLRANAGGSFTNVKSGARSTGSSGAVAGQKPFWQSVQENGF